MKLQELWTENQRRSI